MFEVWDEGQVCFCAHMRGKFIHLYMGIPGGIKVRMNVSSSVCTSAKQTYSYIRVYPHLRIERLNECEFLHACVFHV